MSGHSKWSTIKHKKAITDAKRGVAFTRVAKQIYIAVREGGSGDADKNPALRMALDEARSVNMPNDNVRRAIDKGLGIGGNGEIEIVYEGYGPNGVGVMVTTLTDNKNRTGGEVKNILEKAGGSLGGPGTVSYMKTIDPVPMIELEDEAYDKVIEMIEKLEKINEVSDVWSNLKIKS
jgi:YebC/PmpR family DNA-binding regulatory protein